MTNWTRGPTETDGNEHEHPVTIYHEHDATDSPSLTDEQVAAIEDLQRGAWEDGNRFHGSDRGVDFERGTIHEGQHERLSLWLTDDGDYRVDYWHMFDGFYADDEALATFETFDDALDRFDAELDREMTAAVPYADAFENVHDPDWEYPDIPEDEQVDDHQSYVEYFFPIREQVMTPDFV